MHYRILGDPICRARDVPRMLELATARADGDVRHAGGADELSRSQPRRQTVARHPALIRCHARWVLPIGAPPLRDGWVAIEDNRIVAYGSDAERGEPGRGPRRDIDLGNVAILPGLVNAHTHLELSHLRGRVPAGRTFVSWIRGADGGAARRPDPDAPEILAAHRRRDRGSDSLRDGGRRRHQQHHGRPVRRSRQVRSTAWSSTRSSGSIPMIRSRSSIAR